MRHFIQSFGWAGKGLSAVWREERNFRVEVVIGILAVIAGFIASSRQFNGCSSFLPSPSSSWARS